MKKNGFFPRIPRRNLIRIVAVCLLIIILAGIGSAASRNGSIAENPCNEPGAPEHCIPPSYWMNTGTYTTPVEFPAPSPVWSETIGEYQARAEISGDGKYIIAGSDTGTLRMYDRSGKVLWTVSSPNSSVYAVAISRDGDHVAASFSDPTRSSDENEWQIRFFDRAGKPLWTYSNGSALFTLAVAAGSSPIVAAGGSPVILLDGNGHLVSSQPSEIPAAVWDVTVSDDGEFIAAAIDFGWRTRQGEIMVMDRNGSTVVKFPTAYQASAVRTDRHGETFTAVDDYRLYSFFRNGTQAWNFSSSPPFRSVAMTPDGNGIVAGSQYFVRFFDKTGTQLWNFQDPGYFYDVGISEDGAMVVAGGDDGVYVFEKNGDLRWHFPTLNFVSEVSVSDSGDYFAAGTSGTVMFFNRWGNATVIEPVQPTGIQSIPTTHEIPRSQTTQPAPLSLFVLFFAIGASVLLVFRKKRKNSRLSSPVMCSPKKSTLPGSAAGYPIVYHSANIFQRRDRIFPLLVALPGPYPHQKPFACPGINRITGLRNNRAVRSLGVEYRTCRGKKCIMRSSIDDALLPRPFQGKPDID
jgi:outer membrane protein assembly factor BamB